MSRLSILLVGTGTMGAEHGAAVAGLPDTAIAGFVSRRATRARAMAARFGGAAFTSLQDGLRATRPDAVFILTPTATHLPLVREAAAAGVAILCEKPIAPSRRDADALVAAVRKARVPWMTGHVLRWFPEFRRLRDLCRNGDLGTPAVARLARGGSWPRGSGDWYVGGSGGPLLDLVIHDFDWLRWTFGPVDRIFSRWAPAGKNREQAFTLSLLRHQAGQIAHVEGSWGHGLPFRVAAEIAGSKALADFDSLRNSALEVRIAGARADLPPVAVPDSPLAESPYRAQDRHFLDCVRSGATPAVTPEDALAALDLSLAAIRSARSGKAIKP